MVFFSVPYIRTEEFITIIIKEYNKRPMHISKISKDSGQISNIKITCFLCTALHNFKLITLENVGSSLWRLENA